MGRSKKSPVIASFMAPYPEPILDWSIIEKLSGIKINDNRREDISNNIKLYFSNTNARKVYAQETERFARAAKKLAEEWGKLKPKLTYQDTRAQNQVVRFGNYDEAIIEIDKFAQSISSKKIEPRDKKLSEWDALICHLYLNFTACKMEITLPSLTSEGSRMSPFQSTVKHILDANKIPERAPRTPSTFAQALLRATEPVR